MPVQTRAVFLWAFVSLLVHAQSDDYIFKAAKAQIDATNYARSMGASPSWADCKKISVKYDEAMNEVSGLRSECTTKTKVGHFSEPLGSACRQWAGSASQSWCSTNYPSCVRPIDIWYEIAVEREERVSICYRKAAASSKNRSDAEAALSTERFMYDNVHQLAQRWLRTTGTVGGFIQSQFDDIKKRHTKVLDELEDILAKIKGGTK